MRLGLACGRCLGFRLRRGWWRRFGLEQFGEEGELLGVDPLGAGAIEPAQQLIEAMVKALVLVALLVQGDEQLVNHLLKHDGIVGKRHRQRSAGRRCGIHAHAYRTHEALLLLQKIVFLFWQ